MELLVYCSFCTSIMFLLLNCVTVTFVFLIFVILIYIYHYMTSVSYICTDIGVYV